MIFSREKLQQLELQQEFPQLLEAQSEVACLYMRYQGQVLFGILT